MSLPQRPPCAPEPLSLLQALLALFQGGISITIQPRGAVASSDPDPVPDHAGPAGLTQTERDILECLGTLNKPLKADAVARRMGRPKANSYFRELLGRLVVAEMVLAGEDGYSLAPPRPASAGGADPLLEHDLTPMEASVVRVLRQAGTPLTGDCIAVRCGKPNGAGDGLRQMLSKLQRDPAVIKRTGEGYVLADVPPPAPAQPALPGSLTQTERDILECLRTIPRPLKTGAIARRMGRPKANTHFYQCCINLKLLGLAVESDEGGLWLAGRPVGGSPPAVPAPPAAAAEEEEDDALSDDELAERIAAARLEKAGACRCHGDA